MFTKKNHLDSHMKSSFHCTMASMRIPLQKMAEELAVVRSNTEEILGRMPSKTRTNSIFNFNSKETELLASSVASNSDIYS